MIRRSSITVAGLVVALVAATFLPARPAEPGSKEPEFNAATRSRVVREIVDLLRKRYVYPSKGAGIAASMNARLFAGVYLRIESPEEFADVLTRDLVLVGGDHHLQVVYDPSIGAPGELPDVENKGVAERPRGTGNSGFEKIEVLPGNIGYLELSRFDPVVKGGDTARAAMRVLSDCDAVVIDLRNNSGGSPTMIPLLASYFLGERPIHLGSVNWRGGNTPTEMWSLAEVSGPRMTDLPLMIVTNQQTFSAAEEFAYALKHLGRATVVGQRTRGGAHRGSHVPVGPGFALFVPTGVAVNPKTRTNWEGLGVAPHIRTDPEVAVETAHREALVQLEPTVEGSRAESLRRTIEALDLRRSPVLVPGSHLRGLVGSYGDRKVSLIDGRLWYRHAGQPPQRLYAVGDDVFFAEDAYDLRLRFESVPGTTGSLKLDHASGRIEAFSRIGEDDSTGS